MSDLASSCEYHTPEKTCLAISERPKAQANRQLHCLNDEKLCCCYICDSRSECTISCKYLGATDNAPAQRVEAPKPAAEVNRRVDIKKSVETTSTGSVPVTYCASCNVEMSPKRTKLRIDADNTQPKQFGEYSAQNEETLAVIVYLCPCCGRIEFKADIGTKN